jgi:hypothetical protein
MTDGYVDEMYNPSFQIASVPATSILALTMNDNIMLRILLNLLMWRVLPRWKRMPGILRNNDLPGATSLADVESVLEYSLIRNAS